MNRFFLLFSALILLNAESAARSAEPVPNVVLIISDDQAYTDFGFMGNSEVRTPHLDRLAARSARYVNGYVPSSVCRPSLVTLLTGLYPHQHGVYFNHPPPGNAAFNKMTKEDYVRTRDRSSYLIRAVPTLPRLLGRKGYVSFQTGKFWEGNFRNAGFTEGMTLDRASDAPAFGNRKLPDGSVVAHGNGDAGLVIGRVTMKPIDDFLDKHAGQPFFFGTRRFCLTSRTTLQRSFGSFISVTRLRRGMRWTILLRVRSSTRRWGNSWGTSSGGDWRGGRCLCSWSTTGGDH